ncbi:MAG: dephospho-CoA kinase [Candidatus Neomarinimicrobiota bacterium]|nr:dephospho-CoA kinase [Candidatus Neomarinimicrobiota bacterium]RKY47329.1 MAG: dephospho-CoA kinase [Candidatus Neomarinimicrobiota bacterium]
MMITLGVTGGLGSGKTTACGFLKEKGAVVFDADAVAKNIILTNQHVQQTIEETFNVKVVREGRLDTKKLASLAFVSEENQSTLNNIVHPEVIKVLEEEIESHRGKTELFVVDAPLIFESGLDARLDYTVLIYAKLKIRLERALRRGNLSREEIMRRIKFQMPEEEKKELADFVIDNNGSLEQLRESMHRLYDELVV